jgi:hypothetical protein
LFAAVRETLYRYRNQIYLQQKLNCDAQYDADNAVCRSLPKVTPQEQDARARCWASATAPLRRLQIWCPPSTLDHVVIHHEYNRETHPSSDRRRRKEYSVILEVEEPYPVDDGATFFCQISIQGLDVGRVPRAGGQDGVQALLNALQVAGAILYTCPEYKSGKLRWLSPRWRPRLAKTIAHLTARFGEAPPAD